MTWSILEQLIISGLHLATGMAPLVSLTHLSQFWDGWAEATTMESHTRSDVGWYDDTVYKKTNDRDEFLDLLPADWWSGMDIVANSKKAKTFAGDWGRPCWRKSFTCRTTQSNGISMIRYNDASRS